MAVKYHLNQIVVLLVFILLLTIGLFGSLTVDKFEKSINGMRIAAFKDGLSIYDYQSGKYYTVSPFNDYFKNSQGQKISLIDYQQIKENKYRSDFQSNKFKQILTAISKYIGLYNPTITFYTDKTIRYQGQITGNKLILNRTVKDKTQKFTLNLAMTLTYNADDLIFDSRGNTLYFPSQDIIDLINNQYQVIINKSDSSQKPNYKIYIVNKNLNSYITVKFNSGQDAFIDSRFRFLVIEELVKPTNAGYKNQLEIEINNLPDNGQLIL